MLRKRRQDHRTRSHQAPGFLVRAIGEKALRPMLAAKSEKSLAAPLNSLGKIWLRGLDLNQRSRLAGL